MRWITVALILGATLQTGITWGAGDPAAGAKKAAVCAGCHGPDGISVNPLWPNLAGQHQAYLEKQIKAFRDGDRTEPTMVPFVQSLSDQDAADLAAHFAGLTCR